MRINTRNGRSISPEYPYSVCFPWMSNEGRSCCDSRKHGQRLSKKKQKEEFSSNNQHCKVSSTRLITMNRRQKWWSAAGIMAPLNDTLSSHLLFRTPRIFSVILNLLSVKKSTNVCSRKISPSLRQCVHRCLHQQLKCCTIDKFLSIFMMTTSIDLALESLRIQDEPNIRGTVTKFWNCTVQY